jgi:hypothetical protein
LLLKLFEGTAHSLGYPGKTASPFSVKIEHNLQLSSRYDQFMSPESHFHDFG